MKLMERIRNAWSVLRGGGPEASGPIRGPEELLRELSRGHVAASGANVTPDTAMRVSAVFACVKNLSEDIASLPLILYRRKEPRGKDRAPEHPIYRLLHDRPNEWQTAMEFREMLQAHALLRGNAYALKATVRGRIDELIPLHPDRVSPKLREDGELFYEVRPLLETGPTRVLSRRQVFHLRGPSSNGYTGRSVLGDARDAIGLAFTQEEYASEAYRDGGLTRIALEHPGHLSPKAKENLSDSWVTIYGGRGQRHKPAVLEEGLKASKLGLTAEDLQFIDGRKFQVEDIARFFRMPLHKIGHLDKMTNNNVEQLALDYVVSTLMPWAVRWEQAIQRDLLDQPGDERYFARHLMSGLLRGDPEKRHKAYAIGRQWGYLTANEVRELEDMNPFEGGDEYLVPVNMRGADEPVPPAAGAPAPEEEIDA